MRIIHSLIPDLSLSQGQALWALSQGQPPSQRMIDEARYLRMLGIPFSEEEQNTGRGNRLRYNFDHLCELAIAFYYLRHGLKPKDLGKYIPNVRKNLRKLCRQTFSEFPKWVFEAEWVKSRGKLPPTLPEQVFLQYHDRYSETPGKLVYQDKKITDVRDFSDPVIHLPDGETREALPLTRVVFETIAWALEAPVLKTGPAAAKSKKA